MESKGGLSTTATDRMLEVGIKELRTKELTNERGSQELYEAEKEREREREREKRTITPKSAKMSAIYRSAIVRRTDGSVVAVPFLIADRRY